MMWIWRYSLNDWLHFAVSSREQLCRCPLSTLNRSPILDRAHCTYCTYMQHGRLIHDQRVFDWLHCFSQCIIVTTSSHLVSLLPWMSFLSSSQILCTSRASWYIMFATTPVLSSTSWMNLYQHCAAANIQSFVLCTFFHTIRHIKHSEA
jgi:hypothetical protein